MTTTTIQATNTVSLTQDQLNDMLAKAVAKGVAQAPVKTEAQVRAEARIDQVRNRLADRVRFDLDADAAVGVGLRTAQNQGFRAGGALTALGFENEGSALLAQGEAARYAQRKGLRAEGALGTIRAGLSYIPLVGDAFLGGDGVQERALYSSQRSAHRAEKTAEFIASIMEPVGEQMGHMLLAQTKAAEAQAEVSTARAANIRATHTKERLAVTQAARDFEAKLAEATNEKNIAENAALSAADALQKGKTAKLPKADITLLENALADAEKNSAIATKAYRVASVENGEAQKLVEAYGG